MRVVMISDTHMWGMPLKDLPEGDLLIHAGDGLIKGNVKEAVLLERELSKHLKDSRYKKGYKDIIYVPGNHCKTFEDSPHLAKGIMRDISVLMGEEHISNKLPHNYKIWGSPICPPFKRMSFNWSNEDRKKHWGEIPDDVDILITHTPPYETLDNVGSDKHPKHVGCRHLRDRIMEIKPKLHIFGHIHECHGVVVKGKTTFVNASIKNGEFETANKPIVIDI